MTTDVTDEKAVSRLQEAVSTYGSSSTNAALASAIDLKPIEGISSEEWTRVMEVNVSGGKTLCRYSV